MVGAGFGRRAGAAETGPQLGLDPDLAEVGAVTLDQRAAIDVGSVVYLPPHRGELGSGQASRLDSRVRVAGIGWSR